MVNQGNVVTMRSRDSMLNIMSRTERDNLLPAGLGKGANAYHKTGDIGTMLADAGLKVNADKSTFCALEIEYLGYILSKNGIKPQSNKVQAILAIHPPTGVKQLRHFLGMVQYYRDLWARRSDMLAPLTELVGECGQTKVTRAKGD